MSITSRFFFLNWESLKILLILAVKIWLTEAEISDKVSIGNRYNFEIESKGIWKFLRLICLYNTSNLSSYQLFHCDPISENTEKLFQLAKLSKRSNCMGGATIRSLFWKYTIPTALTLFPTGESFFSWKDICFMVDRVSGVSLHYWPTLSGV